MLHSIMRYTVMKDDVAFLRFKQDYLHIGVWKLAFYVHVFTGIVALLAGFTQFLPVSPGGWTKLHRYAGRVYAWGILVVNFPAGFVLAVYANGMLSSKIAFIILDSLWAWFTWKGVMAAKQRRFALHQEFMVRSYALTLSAITLRLWKIVLAGVLAADPELLYRIDAWLGFVPNLLLAEWYIRHRRKSLSSVEV